MRDLATIEADVTAHLEAVLRERLSKIHRERILKEQRGFESRNTSRRSTARGKFKWQMEIERLYTSNATEITGTKFLIS